MIGPNPQTVFGRRALLRAGGCGFFGLTMPKLLRASESTSGRDAAPREGKVKSVVFLFQWGGPSHLETFDMKPEAPSGIRGPHKPMSTNVPGLFVNECLPRVAKLMDKVTLVRSVHHTMNNHNSAGYYALTGHSPIIDDQRLRDSLELFPAYGSVVDKLAPVEDVVPTFVAYPHTIRDGSITPGQRASFLGKNHDPFYVPRDPNSPDFSLPELSLPEGLTLKRLEKRRALQKMVDQQSKLLDQSAEARGLDDYYRRALALLQSEKVREAFDISKEPEKLREEYGRHTYGQGCLLARRLVESGVKFGSVYFDRSIGGQSTSRTACHALKSHGIHRGRSRTQPMRLRTRAGNDASRGKSTRPNLLTLSLASPNSVPCFLHHLFFP